MAVLLTAAGAAPPAAAQVMQPTGEVMPQPPSAAEVGVVTSRGFPADAVTLEGLFKYRMEMIDTRRDAHTTPGVFSPQCGFKGELVLRGGACKVGLGWYNATPGATMPPPSNQIYQLVPPDPRAPAPMGLMCMDQDFCPLATMMTTQAPQHSWTPVEYSAENIRTDARYRGGLVGFALMGVAGTECSQNKFSQAELNTKRQGTNEPWVATLVYQSTVNPNAYYLAFEDRPSSPTTWKGDNQPFNDGDFNDFVFVVTGVTCSGGGKPCKTELLGECAEGITECRGAGEIFCKSITTGSAEKCDGLDNNCDGMVDEGDLCGPDRVCDRGVCVGNCGNPEFPCAPGLECEAGLCKDARCIGKTCPAGQICMAGVCRGGCEGAVCPHGQICRLGRCFDPCTVVTCDAGAVCEDGACMPRCSCRDCGAGKTCAMDGRCVDTGCDKQACNAPASVCVAGACKDGCDGVVCPAGQECKGGKCEDLPAPPPGSGSGGSVVVDPGPGSGGRVFVSGTGGRPGFGQDAGSDPGAVPGGQVTSCRCDAASDRYTPLALGSLFALLALTRLRRRSRQTDPKPIAHGRRR